jgi:D-alanyl-D-alanine dipeptidase
VSHPLPLSEPRILALPVHECGERLVDVRTVAALRVAPGLTGVADARVPLRTTVIDRLVTAQSLLPRSMRLMIIAGYRDATSDWPCDPPPLNPHLTGAAVDLSLCSETGTPLAIAGAVPPGLDQLRGAPDPVAYRGPEGNLHILSRVLSAVGLTNPPVAWWHWSYGDRYWCCCAGADAARYGPA